MNNLSLKEKLEEVEDKHDDNHPYSMPEEILEKLKVRGKHVLSMDREEWGELLRRRAFQISDVLFSGIKKKEDLSIRADESFVKVLGPSDSMNAATEATHELINIRIKEIGEWLKKQNLMEIIIEGVEAIPKINVDLNIFSKEENERDFKPHDDLSLHD